MDNGGDQSLFPAEKCPQVPDEAFNLFHAIDRELYTRLIHNLGRDPAGSVQVMAFWIWLERETNDMNLIKRMLSLPPSLLNEVADETDTCLKCVETDVFPFGEHHANEVSLLSGLLTSPIVNLRFLHDHRIAVLRGVTRVINTVCSRAFSDILRRTWRGSNTAAYHAAAAAEGGGPAAAVHFGGGGGVREVGESSREAAERRVVEGGGAAPPPPPMMRRMLFHPPHLNVPFVPLPPPHVLTPGSHGGGPPPPPPGLVAADAVGIPIHMLAAAGIFPVYDLAAQRQLMGNELGEMLSRNLSINSPRETTNAVIIINGGVAVRNDGEEEEVGPDDRTIFLTFSKGYPITEDEVREFFTRRFGDFIEDMIMQEVGEEEQVLYARMVSRSMAVIEAIVRGNKAKYSINGKHVWARKYVKKSTSSSSPPRGDHIATGQVDAAVASGSPSS
ncbi:hypothetical protein ACP275_06G178100 [Erythranthe tilingii]